MFGSYGIGSWIALALAMVVFWGAIVTVVLLLLQRKNTTAGPSSSLTPPRNDAERILDERFARGEIDTDEYTARRAVLRRPE